MRKIERSFTSIREYEAKNVPKVYDRQCIKDTPGEVSFMIVTISLIWNSGGPYSLETTRLVLSSKLQAPRKEELRISCTPFLFLDLSNARLFVSSCTVAFLAL